MGTDFSLAPSRRASSRVCRSDRSVTRRCRVAEPGRRFERLGFRLSAIDPDPEGRGGVAAGRPACQRAARVLRCATALRVTRRPSRGSDGSYGPCGPAWTGRPGRPRRPRDAADRRIPDGAPAGHRVACAGTSGRRWRPTRGGGGPGARPRPHQRRPSSPEHAACRGVLRSRVNRRADSSGH